MLKLLSTLLFFLFLILPSHCAASEQALLSIRQAIRSAIIDGLSVVDESLHKDYWYFLEGANMTSYNASVGRDRLNYILLYISGSKVFRANCDLTFAKWEPVLNSFVQVSVSHAALTAIKHNVDILAQSANYLDLTDSTLAVTAQRFSPETPLTVSDANRKQIQSVTPSVSVTANISQQNTPIFPSASGVIVLKPMSSNLSTKP